MASATDWRRLLDTHLVLWCLNGGGVRQPGNVVGDGDQAVDRPAAGGSAGTGAPGAVAGLPLAANQQRPFAGRGGTRDRWRPPGSPRSPAGVPEPGGVDKVMS